MFSKTQSQQYRKKIRIDAVYNCELICAASEMMWCFLATCPTPRAPIQSRSFPVCWGLWRGQWGRRPAPQHWSSVRQLWPSCCASCPPSECSPGLHTLGCAHGLVWDQSYVAIHSEHNYKWMNRIIKSSSCKILLLVSPSRNTDKSQAATVGIACTMLCY